MLWKNIDELNGEFVKEFINGDEAEVLIHYGNHIYVVSDETCRMGAYANEFTLEVTICKTTSHELKDLQEADYCNLGCFCFNPINKGESDSWCNFITCQAEADLIVSCIKKAEEEGVTAWNEKITWKEEVQ